MPAAQPVSLYIITFNDADNLRAVLPTVLWADEVLVVDSFSTDDTRPLNMPVTPRGIVADDKVSPGPRVGAGDLSSLPFLQTPPESGRFPSRFHEDQHVWITS
jgi:hypothetical protein